MIRSEQFKVGETAYDIATFTATKGLGILQRLLKVIGPATAEIIGNSLEGDDGEAEIETAAFGKAVQLLMAGLADDDLAALVKDLLSATTISGKEIPFDLHFAGNYGDLSKLLFEILKINYSSFFVGSDFANLVQQARDRIST